MRAPAATAATAPAATAATAAAVAVVTTLAAVAAMSSCAPSAAAPEGDAGWRAALAGWKAGAPWPNVPLIDDAGAARTLHEVVGHVGALVGFVYTRCPVETMCPATMRNLVRAHRESGARVLVVTLDPEHDTPQALRDYRRRFGVDDDDRDFVLVTGDAEPLLALASLENVTLVNGAHKVTTVRLDERYVAHTEGGDEPAPQ